MKVAVLIDTWFPFVGGGQINAFEISKIIARNGHKIEIITRNLGQNLSDKHRNIKIVKLGAPSSTSSPFAKLFFLLHSIFYIKRSKFDLVHAHAFLPGLAARFLMVTKGIPAVFTVHGTSIQTSLLNYPARRFEKFLLTEILYSAQITVSRDFLNIKNVNKEIAYIPNGVDIKAFDKVKANKAPFPTLIFVGRLHRQKNLSALFRAVQDLRSQFPDVMLLVVGQGPAKKELVRILKYLKLKKSVKLLGEVSADKLIRLYKTCHLFVLPSIYEGQPLTLLEAWAAKLPVVVTRTGDCTLLIKEGKDGYLIDNPFDPIKISQKISKALKNRNLDTLGENGYNFVKRNFSWQKSAQKTLELYEKVLAASS